MRKSLLALFIVIVCALSALQYYCSRIFAKATRCNKPDGQTSAQTEREPRRHRKLQVAVKNSRGPRAAFLRASRQLLQRLRLVLETTLCVEFLLAGSEYKFLTTFLAY